MSNVMIADRGHFLTLCMVLGMSALVWFVSPMLGTVCLLTLLGVWIYQYPEVGLYGMVLFAPMIGLVVDGAWIQRVLEISFFPPTFFAPLVDVWTTFVLGIYLVRLILRYLDGTVQTIVLPGVWLYGAFLLSGVLSLVHLPDPLMFEGLKYIIRFPLFVYVGYMVLGMQLMHTPQHIERSLRIFVSVAGIAALLGVVSLVQNFSAVIGLYRAVPVPFFGIDVFNYAGDIRYGHILLAEHLTVAIPMAIYLMYYAPEAKKRWYMWLTTLLISVCVLTFSRAGWLTLAVQATLAAVVFRSYIPWKKYVRYVPISIAMLAIPALYMFSTLSSQTVTSSNEARIVLTEIGWFQFLDRPIFGQGAGQFIPILEDTYFFVRHFGDPVDAHSIVTKIMTEQGLFGLITFFLFIGWMLKEILYRAHNDGYTKDARIAAVLGLLLVVTPLFFQLFNTQYYAARMWLPIVIAIALVFVYRNQKSYGSMYISFLPKKKNTIISNIFKS